MIEEIKRSLAVSFFFENAMQLYMSTNYVHDNKKPTNEYKGFEFPFDRKYERIFEYSSNVLRYSEIIREFIGSYSSILKKYIDLHFFQNGIVLSSDYGDRIFHDPQLILKYEHLILMQKSLFEGHPNALLMGYFSSIRRTEFKSFAEKMLDDYIKPFLIPIRNMIAHPKGNQEYVSRQDWKVVRKGTSLNLEIKINEGADIGSYVSRDLSEIWKHQICKSLEIIEKIIELIIAEMNDRYNGFREEDIRFSKYIKGKTPNTVQYINEDLIRIDFNAFELSFI